MPSPRNRSSKQARTKKHQRKKKNKNSFKTIKRSRCMVSFVPPRRSAGDFTVDLVLIHVDRVRSFEESLPKAGRSGGLFIHFLNIFFVCNLYQSCICVYVLLVCFCIVLIFFLLKECLSNLQCFYSLWFVMVFWLVVVVFWRAGHAGGVEEGHCGVLCQLPAARLREAILSWFKRYAPGKSSGFLGLHFSFYQTSTILLAFFEWRWKPQNPFCIPVSSKKNL